MFGCSLSQHKGLKDSGKIKKALTQVGRKKIVVDADKALELYKNKKKSTWKKNNLGQMGTDFVCVYAGDINLSQHLYHYTINPDKME